MTQAPSSLVSTAGTLHYHCVSPCVRRAYWCGFDSVSQADYEYRRAWLKTKRLKTAEAFVIYAVMNNHYHVVIQIRTDLSSSLSDREVVQKWHSLFKGNHISQSFIAGDALLDERALLACRRSKPDQRQNGHLTEQSDHMRVKARLTLLKQGRLVKSTIEKFVGSNPEALGLTLKLKDYFELTDWAGRLIREEPLPSGYKRGAIDDALPPIVERLALDQDAWGTLATQFERQFSQWVGSEHIVRQVYSDKHYQRTPSTSQYRKLIG